MRELSLKDLMANITNNLRNNNNLNGLVNFGKINNSKNINVRMFKAAVIGMSRIIGQLQLTI